VENTRIFQIGHIVMGYWSHCNGLPAEWKNTRIFQIGRIVMGYLPSEKIRGFFKSGHIVMGYLPGGKYDDFSDWSHCNGLPAQWKNTRIFQKMT